MTDTDVTRRRDQTFHWYLMCSTCAYLITLVIAIWIIKLMDLPAIYNLSGVLVTLAFVWSVYDMRAFIYRERGGE